MCHSYNIFILIQFEAYLNASPMLTDAEISQNHHQEDHNGEEDLEDMVALRLYFLIFKTERTARKANNIIIDSKRMYLDCARNAVSKNESKDNWILK